MIEIRIILVFQCEFKTIEESRVLLTKCIKINDSLKHLTMFRVVVIDFFQCADEFID